MSDLSSIPRNYAVKKVISFYQILETFGETPYTEGNIIQLVLDIVGGFHNFV